MTIKINGRPIRVQEEKEKIDWIQLIMTCTAYGLIIWIIRLAAHVFLGGM